MFMFLVCHSCQENIGTGFNSFSHFMRSLFLVLLLRIFRGFCINSTHSIFPWCSYWYCFHHFFVRHLLDRVNRVTSNEERRKLKKEEWMRETNQIQTQEHKLKKLSCTRSNRKHNTKSEILNKIRHSNGTETMEKCILRREDNIRVGYWKAGELHG